MWLNGCKWDIISLIFKKLRPSEELFKYFVVTISEKNWLKCLLLEYLSILLFDVTNYCFRAAELFGEWKSFRKPLKLFGFQSCFCDICQPMPLFFLQSLQLKSLFCSLKQKHLKFRIPFMSALFASLLAIFFHSFSKNPLFRS